MKKIEFVSTRLKPGKELFGNTSLENSRQVYNMFRDDFEEMPEGTIGILNVNQKGKVINIQYTTVEEFPKIARNTLSIAAISNAAAVMLLSNVQFDENLKKLTAAFEMESSVCGIKLMDHICEMNTYWPVSFNNEGLIGKIDHILATYDPNLFSACEFKLMEKDYEHLARVELVTEKNVEVEDNSIEEATSIIIDDLKLADREKLYVLNLDKNDKVLNINCAAIGSLDSASMHPRELLKASMLSNASSIIMFHNHPSSDTEPSEPDKEATRRAKDSSKLFGIELKEHYIVAALTGEKRGILDESRINCFKISAGKENVEETQPKFSPTMFSSAEFDFTNEKDSQKKRELQI